MSSYIIQGSSDSVELAKIEWLIEKIEEIDSSIDFKLIIEDKGNWSKHIQEVCRSYGFKREFNPIIYKNNGELLGDYYMFLDWILLNY